MDSKNNKKKYIISVTIAIIIVIVLLLMFLWPKNVTVTLNIDGKISETLRKGGIMEEPDEPEKEGYTFLGWYLDDEKFDFDTPIKESIVLEPKWEKNKYTITISTGSETITETVEYGNTLDTLKSPIMNGYTFIGWYLGDKEFDFNTKITGDIKLEARFKKNNSVNVVKSVIYTVEHYLMDKNHEYNTPVDVETFSVLEGSIVNPNTKTYKGYTSPSTQKVTVKSDTVIKYYYTINEYKLSIKTDKGVKSVKGSGTYFYGDEVKIEYELNPGYTFDNFSEKLDDNVYKMEDKDVVINITTKANEDTKYTVEHYKMNLEGNYDDVEPEIETLEGTTDTSVTPNIKDYTGFTSPDEVEANINGDESTVVKYYYERNKYTLTLKGDKGIESVKGSGKYYFETKVDISASIKDGYTFKSWSNGSESTDFEYEVIDDDEITATTSLITYNITIDYDGGSAENRDTYTVEDEFILNIPTKDGYTFKNWIINGEESDGVIKNTTGALEIKAVYTPNKNTAYTVEHYKMNLNGTYDDVKPEIENKTGETDTDAIYEDKNYVGFTLDSSISENKTINGKGDTVVKVYYSRNKYSLTLKAGYGVDSSSLKDKSEYYFEEEVELSANALQGYTFKGNWKQELETEDVEEGIFNNNAYKMPASNVELTAVAVPNDNTNYTVNYYYMDTKGIYSELKQITKQGTTDSSITITPEDVVGFKTPSSITQSINGNGDTVFDFYYEREKHKLIIVNFSGVKDITIDGKSYDEMISDLEPLYFYYEQTSIIEVTAQDGYHFKSWGGSIDNKNNSKIEFTMGLEDVMLSANMEINTYTVEFNGNGGVTKDNDISYTQEFTYNETKTLKANLFERVGYTFIGWALETTSDFKYGNEAPVSNLTKENNGTVKLYAVWEIDTNTVTFDANGGYFETKNRKELNVPNQEYGKTIAKPKSPTREGYTFTDIWCIDSECSEEWDFEEGLMPDKGLTLYAKWRANTYTIKYEGNNNTSGNIEVTTCTYDEECKLNKNDFVKQYTVTYNEGYDIKEKQSNTQTVQYKFLNWKYGGNVYNDLDTVSNLTAEDNAIVILKAEWQIDSSTAILKQSTREGYTLDGWYNNDKKQDSLNDISKNLELTAHWNANKYHIKYDSNKGKGSTNPSGTVTNTDHTYDTISDLSNNTYTRDGYQFLGWSTTKHDESVDSCGSDCITNANNLTAKNDGEVTLYAVWKANTYTITYNGGNSTSGSMDTTTCTFDQDCELNENKYVKEYIVSFDKNDKTKESLPSQTVQYDFKDWKNGSDIYKDRSNVKNLTVNNNDNVTITAEWKVNESTTSLTSTKRIGYNFSGWYKDDKTKLENLNNVEETLTLKAHWTPITYTIVFDGNGGKSTDGKDIVEITAIYDKETEVINGFTKSYNIIYNYNNGSEDKTVSKNMIFNGWKLNDENYTTGNKLVNLAQEQDAKVTLVAQYTNPTVTIEETNPTKDNNSDDKYYSYEFKDWKNGKNTYKKDDSIILDGDITLTAEYLKVIDTDEYIKENMITKDRKDIKTSSDLNNYTIDILSVNEPIVNEKDIDKIKNILSNEDVISVKLSSESNNVTITNEEDARSKIDEFLAKETNTTIEKVESEKHLSSLFKKNISIVVNFDKELAKTTTNETSIKYNLTYTNENKNIITKEEIEKILNKAKTTIDKNNKYVVKATSDISRFSVTYSNPTAKLLYLNGLSASGELSGAGIKTAFWVLLGNPKQASSYPETFIKRLDITLISESGEEREIKILPSNVADGGEFLSAWKLFGLSLISDLEKVFGMKSEEITNETLKRISGLHPFKVKFILDSDKALEEPYQLEYSFDFTQR